MQGCIGSPESCIGRLIDGGRSILDTGSSILGGGAGILLGGSSGGGGGPTQQCNESTQSGHEGVTDTNHRIGRGGPTSFVLDYETFSIPDDIQVFYQGALIYDTGYVGNDNSPGQGTGSVSINVPAGSATTVMVRVTGPNSTDWNYTVHCPNY